MNECGICGDIYTGVRRKKVVCPDNDCSEHCCINCFKKYLLTSEFIEPKCMFCSKNISYSFIRKTCNSIFCNKDLHEKRTGIEIKRQLSLLPATQHLATLELERRAYFKELDLYDERIFELRRQIGEIERQKRNVPYPCLGDIKNKPDSKITFNQKCPVENCKGFLSSSWKCGICENFICSKCIKVKKSRDDKEHVCDENDVSSVEKIKKDSKPCPKCGTYIFKIDGCDQMWCPECKTAFSWKTGMIELGTIHNPHYFQYMTQTEQYLARQPGDVLPCEIIPNFVTVTSVLNSWKNVSTEHRKMRLEISAKITTLVRSRRHVEFVLLRKYTYEYEHAFQQNRVDLLLNRIDEEILFQKTKKLIKMQEKNTEFLQIYNLYLTVSGEILKNLIQMIEEKKLESSVQEEFKKVSNLIKYCNNELWILRNSFKNEATMIEKI